jgi:DNA primase
MSHSHLEDFLSRLSRVKKSGTKYTACCPVHGDEHPSLSIAIGNNGGILVHCHAQQCKVEDIAHAVGMKMIDFAPPDFTAK